ncbi:thioesterase II family protein [Cohnella sp. WQ 127256]|uniref:thioesterase II family protein n=1 Tax=Cohnella sp. WQ 127256 TaxID=2938790 RepID=UPI00211964B5|nr:alpha/beta fold hydrolase [Cohnella sp. WQ 127256]
MFCFAHAGGSAVGFNKWKKRLDPRIELCPIELRGRGTKGGLPFYESITEAVQDLYPLLVKEAGGRPYALLGHSMGTLLIYEMCHHIRKMGFRDPNTVLFSGRIAPHLKEDEKVLHLLPDDEFTAEIKKLGLTPAELFEHKELLNLFMPILKADYRMIETYECAERPQPINSEFVILTGREDEWTQNRIKEWIPLTARGCQFHEFEGGHFFLYEQMTEVIPVLDRCLLAALSSVHV